MRRNPRSFVVLVAALGGWACDGGGGSTDAGRDAPFPDVPLPVGTACDPATEPVSVADPDEVVGDGTPGSCTEAALRAAVDRLNAGGGGTLVFDCGAEAHTIELSSAIRVEEALVIDGGDRVTLSGGRTTRILDCDHYVDLAVQNVTFAEGRTEESGSAIHLPWFGSLRVFHATFRDNECTRVESDIGGAIYGGGLETCHVAESTFVRNRGSNGGAIVVNGSNLAISDSVFAENTAFGHGGSSGDGGLGGAVYIDGMNREAAGARPFALCGSVFRGNRSNGHGGAIFQYFYPGQTATIRRCVIDDNHVGDGRTGGAIYHEGGPLQLLDTTLSNNTAEQHAGAIFIGTDSPSRIVNCTFWGNEVPEVGAGIFSVAQDIEIVNSTFAHHHADYGPAIYSETGRVTLRNSILAHNRADGPYNGQSCSRTLDEGEHNLQWPAQRPNGTADRPCVEGIAFADPLLGDLADHGGPAPTAAPADGSPALGAGADCPEADQRGEPRAEPCDLGAHEVP